MANEVPPTLKLHGRRRSTTKHLLRSAMTDVLPDEVLRQHKAGFGAPAGEWINGPARPLVDELLAPGVLAARGWFDPAGVAGLLDRHRSGRDDYGLQIWALLTFELWQRAFTDASPGDFQSWLG
jgi:asparagine synthase (glutamine-hydrolysing)